MKPDQLLELRIIQNEPLNLPSGVSVRIDPAKAAAFMVFSGVPIKEIPRHTVVIKPGIEQNEDRTVYGRFNFRTREMSYFPESTWSGHPDRFWGNGCRYSEDDGGIPLVNRRALEIATQSGTSTFMHETKHATQNSFLARNPYLYFLTIFGAANIAGNVVLDSLTPKTKNRLGDAFKRLVVFAASGVIAGAISSRINESLEAKKEKEAREQEKAYQQHTEFYGIVSFVYQEPQNPRS